MKKVSPTSFFACLVLLLGAYTYWFEIREPQKAEEQKKQELQYLSFKRDQVDSIRLEGSGQNIEIKRSVTGWDVVSPYVDQADTEEVESLVKAVYDESALSVVQSGDEIDWSKYGLQTPAGQLTFTTSGGLSETLLLSDKRNFQNDIFMRKSSVAKVFLAQPNLLSWAQKKADDFRDKKVVRGSLIGLESIQVKSQGDSFVLQQKEAQWILSQRPSWVLEQNQVRGFVKDVSELKGTEFIAEGVGAEKELKARGLGRPLLSVELVQPEKVRRLDLLRAVKTNETYAYTHPDQKLWKVSKNMVDKWANLKAHGFREKSSPFYFDEAKVNLVQGRTGLKVFALKVMDGQWRMVGDDSAKPQADKIKAFIGHIRNSKVLEYTEQKIDFSKGSQIILRDSEGQDLLDLRFIEKDGKTFAKTQLIDEAFVMDESFIKGLSLEGLVE